MRLLLQRVTQGHVSVDNEIVGSVDHGFVALIGITHDDTKAIIETLAAKTVNLRVFDDEAGKMNRSALDVGAGILVVSQFTLYANARNGRRPDYIRAARPDHAAPLVEYFVERLRAEGIAHVATGVFGAMMQVHIENDGPVTIWLDSADFV